MFVEKLLALPGLLKKGHRGKWKEGEKDRGNWEKVRVFPGALAASFACAC